MKGFFRLQFHFKRLFLLTLSLLPSLSAEAQLKLDQLQSIQQKVFKVYGSGGFANLHSYQTGSLISNDGLIVTVWSHVLDGKITAVDAVGKRFKAEFVGMDPTTDLALLKIPSKQIAHFDLNQEPIVFTGQTVLGFSNLFGIASKNELVSVMRGVVSTTTRLDGQAGAFDSSYAGPVIVVDLITNNPGAAGGVIVDLNGNLIGFIGKELKNKQTGLWLNFCLPVKVVSKSVKRIRDQKSNVPTTTVPVAESFSFRDIGLELVPQVLPSTRPYVDKTYKKSVARKLGFKPDDLIVFVNSQPVRTLTELNKAIATIDRDATFRLTIKRGNDLVNLNVSRVPQ